MGLQMQGPGDYQDLDFVLPAQRGRSLGAEDNSSCRKIRSAVTDILLSRWCLDLHSGREDGKK